MNENMAMIGHQHEHDDGQIADILPDGHAVHSVGIFIIIVEQLPCFDRVEDDVVISLRLFSVLFQEFIEFVTAHII